MNKPALSHYHRTNGNSGINLPSFDNPITDFFPLKALPHLATDFTINAPNVKIEPFIEDTVSQISSILHEKSKCKKIPRDKEDWSLTSILTADDSEGKSLKSFLIRDGKSAVISEVSKKLNKSNLEHTTKYILNKEPFYVYALAYAIYYEKVSDVGGLYNRVLNTYENEIKPYLDIKMVEEYIFEKHLKLSEAQARKISLEVKKATISYLKGEPIKVFNNVINKYVNYGNLNYLVDQFFELGHIQKDRGTHQIKQLMVQYLADIGLEVPDKEVEDSLKGKNQKESGEPTISIAGKDKGPIPNK